MKVRDRPYTMTRNPKKQIIELDKLMRSDTRISTPTNGSTGNERHDIIKGRGLNVRVHGLLYQRYIRVEVTTIRVMTYSLPLIQLFTN